MVQALPAWLFPYIVVFARLGSAMAVMPPFADQEVSARVRLVFALALTVMFVPVVTPLMPPLPASPTGLLLVVGAEVAVGLFLGTVVRLLVAALPTAGQMLAFLTGMANALVFDPIAGQQGALVGRFFGLTGVLLILVTDLHHLLIEAIVDSYALFVPGALPPVGDFTEVIVRTVSESFAIAFQLTAPFVVVALIFYLGLGFMVRLVPTIQVFFVALPLQVMNGLLIMMITVAGLMTLFLGRFEDDVVRFLAPR
ncbi:MAG: flagellar biosynthetic protein FliR [Proteobacteria bacterium]|nr:flagellar biosynthetic protein FliR [Pseudomonadota bacterium]